MEIKKTLLVDQELKKEYEVTVPKEIVILIGSITKETKIIEMLVISDR